MFTFGNPALNDGGSVVLDVRKALRQRSPEAASRILLRYLAGLLSTEEAIGQLRSVGYSVVVGNLGTDA